MEELEEKNDREMLKKLPLEKLFDVFFLHIRNLWRWIEARDLKGTLGIERVENAETLLYLLRNTSWTLYQTKKAVEIDSSKNVGRFRVVSCRVQEARLRKGLEIFPCKRVRFGYLRNFAKELNPNFEVECIVCPPDEKPPDYWCEWEIRLKDKENE